MSEYYKGLIEVCERFMARVKYYLIDNGESSVPMLTSDFEAMREVVEIVKESLSQPPADQWIPCSEELPEGYTAVIACSTDGGIHLNHYMTERGYWYYYKDEITAWMPLPKPYKED